MFEAGDALPDPMRRLGESVQAIIVDTVRLRDFMGRRVAREAMDELGLSGVLDEVGDAALEDMLGVAVTSGIVLATKGRTDHEDIANEITRLADTLPGTLGSSMERAIAYMVPLGVAFHRDDLVQRSARVEAWRAEFDLLNSIGPAQTQMIDL